MHALCSANVLNTHWKVGPALLTLYFRKPWFRESKQFGQCDTVRIEGTSLYIYVMVSQRCSYSWYAILPLQARCLHIWTVYILTIILFSVWKKIWSQKSCFWNRDVISWVKACCSFSSIKYPTQKNIPYRTPFPCNQWIDYFEYNSGIIIGNMMKVHEVERLPGLPGEHDLIIE